MLIFVQHGVVTMKPVTFQVSKEIPKQPTDIAAEIADMARWSEFQGYGSLPGIAQATYETRTAQMAGSRIRVLNTDGSSHVEEILVWEPDSRIVMKLYDFTPPLSRLAAHFIETWTLQPHDGVTHVTRQFQLFPTNPLTRPFLWLISHPFRRAITAHLNQIAI